MGLKKYLIILIIFLIYLFSGIYIVSKFRSLPSPIYGGDLWYQHGVVQHILSGGNPLESSSIRDAVPGYLPVYALIVASFAKFFRLEALKAMILLSPFFLAFAFLLWYVCLNCIFKRRDVALLGSVFAINFGFILKYTDFARLLVLPVFGLLLYKWFKHTNLRNMLFLSIVYGILPLVHMVLFIGATITLAIFFLVKFIEFKKEKKFKSFLLMGVIFVFVSGSLALLYWYKPLFIHKLHIAYDRTHIDIPDFGRADVAFKFIWTTIKSIFLNFGGFKQSISTIFCLIGLVSFLFMLNKRSDLYRFMRLFLISALVSTFSYFITEPLLGMNFIPHYMRSFTLFFGIVLLQALGISFVLSQFKKKKVRVSFFCGMLVLLLSASYVAASTLSENRFYKNAFAPLPPAYAALKDWILANTDVNDVFISTKELSFMLNSLTGRKLLTNRWAHQNDPYTNMPERDLIAALILYGDNVEKKLELIKRYDVKYLYWDSYWINSEYQDRKFEYMYDPLIVLDSPKNRKILSNNGVKFKPMYFWVDPSSRRKDVRRFNVLIITPENYFNETHPWKPDLDRYLEKAWSYNNEAVIYRIKCG